MFSSLNRACVPCNTRKVRCVAPTSGAPCRACVSRGCQSSCVRNTRRPRGSQSKRSLRTHTSLSYSGEQIYSPPVDVPKKITAHNSGSESSKADFPSPPNLDHTYQSRREEQACIQICNEIGLGGSLPSVTNILDSVGSNREIIAYRNSTNPLHILGGVLGTKHRRLTRVLIRNEPSHVELDPPRCVQSQPAPEAYNRSIGAIRALIAESGAFSTPAKPYCEQLLNVYFETCYQYEPVIDRVEFLESYRSGKHSAFLLQSVLASAVQYAPVQLLRSCGYNNRHEAQDKFYSNAVLLYDLGFENSQLRMLQGSLVLGTSILSYTIDKDFRYWIHNAVRLATKMGLHRSNIEEDLDPSMYKLCRRIWWVIYNNDIMLSLTGFWNVRMLDSSDCDTTTPKEDDWEVESLMMGQDVPRLLPVSRQQKLYLIEFSKLSFIGERCLAILKNLQRGIEMSKDNDVSSEFSLWRSSLPRVLQVDTQGQDHVDGENVIPIVLMATSYRYECIFYRTLRKLYMSNGQDQQGWIYQRLKNTMLELDTLVGKAITSDIVQRLPLNFVNCVYTVLALRTELAVDAQESAINRSMAYTYIRQGLLFLHQIRTMPTVDWVLRVFDYVFVQKNLKSFVDIHPAEFSNRGDEGFLGNSVLGNNEDETSSSFTDPLPIELGGYDNSWFDGLLGYNFVNEMGL
ncbi:fungal-specific transcription factor domain-containing protein [Xylariales sp. PMI_506]|nr:fungal-specific transcription factor domain-containing protein [Xylariales sp. PMI_506]